MKKYIVIEEIEVMADTPEEAIMHRRQGKTIRTTVKGKKRWPAGTDSLKQLARPEDIGLGDIVEREIGPINGEVFNAWFERTFGKPCRGTWNKETLNIHYPL